MTNKIIFAILFSIISISPVLSQTQKGSLLIGGGANLGLTNTESDSRVSGTLRPNIGVFVADGFALGLSPSFNFSRANSRSSFGLGISPFVRYYFNTGELVKPFIHANFGYSGNSFVDPFNNEMVWRSGIQAGGGAGLAFFLNKNVSLEVKANYNWANFENINPINNANISAGFQIHIPSGKE